MATVFTKTNNKTGYEIKLENGDRFYENK